ncbi:MAG: flagellar motor switch protein FliN [Deltaproteobacteria bacterium]|nr:flagellar motor switch protein FliN [Deltaproteobacteria bacterium]
MVRAIIITTEVKRMAEDNGKDKATDNPAESDTDASSRENTQNDEREKENIEKQSESPETAKEISDEMQAVEDFDLNLLLDIPLEITVELGRTSIQIQELLELGPGSAVTLSKLEGEPVDILANEKLIARGEVVLQNKKYGIRITEITSRMNRIKSLH